MKYIEKSTESMSKEELENRITINAVEAKKDTEVETSLGTILVTKGNYVVTRKDGSKFGITPQDLSAIYEPYSKK